MAMACQTMWTRTVRRHAFGNYVWLDANGNGIQDVGETAGRGYRGDALQHQYGGRRWRLSRPVRCDHHHGGVGGLCLPESHGSATTTWKCRGSTALVATRPNQGNDDAVDSDFVQVGSHQHWSHTRHPTGIGDTRPRSKSSSSCLGCWPVSTCLGQTASSTSTPTKTANVKLDEETVPGIVVVLYDEQLNIVARIPSDSNGAYAFANLAPGQYLVRVPKRPAACAEASMRPPSCRYWHRRKVHHTRLRCSPNPSAVTLVNLWASCPEW